MQTRSLSLSHSPTLPPPHPSASSSSLLSLHQPKDPELGCVKRISFSDGQTSKATLSKVKKRSHACTTPPPTATSLTSHLSFFHFLFGLVCIPNSTKILNLWIPQHEYPSSLLRPFPLCCRFCVLLIYFTVFYSVYVFLFIYLFIWFCFIYLAVSYFIYLSFVLNS